MQFPPPSATCDTTRLHFGQWEKSALGRRVGKGLLVPLNSAAAIYLAHTREKVRTNQSPTKVHWLDWPNPSRKSREKLVCEGVQSNQSKSWGRIPVSKEAAEPDNGLQLRSLSDTNRAMRQLLQTYLRSVSYTYKDTYQQRMRAASA